MRDCAQRAFASPDRVDGLTSQGMPLTHEELEAIRCSTFADDMAIDVERMSGWTSQEAKEYFESRGESAPGSATTTVSAPPPLMGGVSEATLAFLETPPSAAAANAELPQETAALFGPGSWPSQDAIGAAAVSDLLGAGDLFSGGSTSGGFAADPSPSPAADASVFGGDAGDAGAVGAEEVGDGTPDLSEDGNPLQAPPPARTRSMQELDEIFDGSSGAHGGRPALGELRTREEEEEAAQGEGSGMTASMGATLLHDRMGLPRATAKPPGSDDPNQLSSPLGTELLHRKVAFQMGLSDVAEDPREKPTFDPNERSSPFATELHHRRVANQQARPEMDPNRLSSPLGTDLLHRKVARQTGVFADLADDAEGDETASAPVGYAMARDPNQCSSPLA